MSNLFAWVPWFQELARKIADGGPEYLVPRTHEIPWNKDGERSRLLKYGDENIDPFSFFYVLASKNGMTQVHSVISERFQLSAEVDFQGGFYYPTPQARAKLLFHSGGRGNTALLWRLFRSAVTGLDSINGREFNEALSIKNVGISKLTRTLFLMNPRAFLPFDKQSLSPLRRELQKVHDWAEYQQELELVSKMFPGCEPYEIQHFAYAVFGRNELDVKRGEVWRSSTNVGTEEPDGWEDFRENGQIHYREPPFALRHPAPGDVVLVHTGLSRGRGIGVVHRNDHKEPWTPEQPLRVLWLNTVAAKVSESAEGWLSGEKFSRAKKTLDTFQSIPEYAPTFELLTRLGWKERENGEEKKLPDLAKKQHPPPSEIGDLAKKTLIAESELRKIVDLLEDKKQVIFQGPPGTGKTFLARKLAECLAGSPDRVRLVQFHPSYAYEDFVQGFRPTLKDGQAGFTLRDGPLLEMAKLASQSDANYYLIIDEINRGNLSKILGEFYFLLEYRDEKIQLQYSDREQRFSLPPSLYIIGTMNTADRSIALVDLALRRRFHFVEFNPDKPPIQGLLGRWLERHAPGMRWVEQVVERANKKLDDRHAAIGPSYFMREGLDDTKVRMIWEHNVLPYVEERLFGQEDQLKEFSLDRLRNEAEGHPPQPGNEANSDASGAGASGNEAD